MIKLEKDEVLILEVRKHPFIFFTHTAVTSFFAFLPLFIYLIVIVAANITVTGKIFWISTFFYSLWLLIIWIIYFIQWTDYYLDVWYVTNKKIYDVLQSGFFHRQVSILSFNNIQDITVSIEGIIPTMLDFGLIHVQTAGESSADFLLEGAKNPNKVKDVISKLHAKSRIL